jgi:hypothetical protein
MNKFKPGDRVRMKYFDGYATGEITIVTEDTCKIIFDGDFDLAYWYYPKSELELIDGEKEHQETKRNTDI